MPDRNRLFSAFASASLGLLLMVGPASSQEPAQPPADARFQAAGALFTQKKYAEAATALEKLVAEFPKHPKAVRARLQLGVSLLETGRAAPAAVVFQSVLTEVQSPDLRFEAHYGAGRSYLALKDDEKAVQALAEAAKLSEQDREHGPAVRLLLGAALQRAGKPEEAVKVFTDFLNRWPEHADEPQAYFGVGESNRLAGNHLEAAVTFRNFTDKHWRLPLASQAALRSGDAFRALGRLADAEREYRRVLKDYLESAAAPRAQIGLGRLAFARRDYPSARAAFEAAAVVFTKANIGSETELRIAETYLAEKNTEEAAARYTALTASADAGVAREGRYGLGLTHLADGRLPAATAEFTRLAEVKEAGRWSHLSRLRLAEVRSAAGDHAAAVALIRPLLTDRPDPDVRDEAALVLGAALLRAEDLAGAEAELSHLLQRAPEGPYAGRAIVLMAELRVAGMKPAEGAALLTKVLEGDLEPDLRAAALAGLGQARLKNKQEKEGVAVLEEVLEKHAAAPAAAGAARALLTYFQASGQAAEARKIELLLEARYGGSPASADDALLAQAEQLAAAGKYADALTLQVQLSERNLDRNRRWRVRVLGAECLAGLKKPEGAASVAALTGEAPTGALLATARYRIGRAYEQAGNSRAALAEYRGARSAGPDDEIAPALLLALGRLLGDTERHAEAEPALRELITKHPKSDLLPSALYELAWGYLDQGKSDQARPVFVRLATDHAAHPLAGDAAFRVAEQDFKAGDFNAAASRYRSAAAGKSDVADEAAYKLGWCLRRTGDHAGAAQAFLRTVELAPAGALALESRVRAGEALLGLEKEKEALAQFDAVLAAQPRADKEKALLVQAKVGAALAYLMGGETEKALALATETALPANGWYGARAQLVRAEATFLKEGPKAAVVEFSRGANLYTRHRDVAAEAWFRAAECHDKLGDMKAAQAAWQRVMEQFAGTAWAERSRERLGVKPAALER